MSPQDPDRKTGLPAGKSSANHDWVVDFCNFAKAWAMPKVPSGGTRMGEGVVVVHPDTGYTEHPELLAGNRYPITAADAINFHTPNRSARDWLLGLFPSHGTSTASVMMSGVGHPGVTHPSLPELVDYTPTATVTGVAPKVKVLPYLVTQSVLLDDFSDGALAKAINRAIGLNTPPRNDIGVISISLGRPESWGSKKALRNALQATREAGIIVCAAAGQKVTWLYPGPTYPGKDPNTIGVAACDSTHVMMEKGRYGDGIDITAPGVNVWIARAERVNGTPVQRYLIYGDGTGTSYATAIVAGACALWQAHHGRANLIAAYGAPLMLPLFREVLKRSCDKRAGNWDTDNHGPGILDARALLAEELPPESEIPNP